MRRPVVHLTGIDHNDVADGRIDMPYTAPGALSTERNDADSELIVCVARKHLIGYARDRF